MDIKKEREAFVENYRKVYKVDKSLFVNDSGEFTDLFCQDAWVMWQATKAQVVLDTYTPIVLALEDVQSKIAKTSFLTMDEENENEVMAVDANELAAYIDELIEAQEPTND